VTAITIDRELIREVLRTLRQNETALRASDTLDAAVACRSAVEYAPLTLETIRAREWLEDALADAAPVL
jgi:hypothetical protein